VPPEMAKVTGSTGVEKKQLFKKILKIIEEMPEVRPDKMAAVKEALERGTYVINPRKLANIILAELLLGR
jgi:anti-sigma28 factor (negative regulator of flagellin synthesis)